MKKPNLTPATRSILFFGFAAILSALAFAHIHRVGLVNLLVDAQSHWIFAFLMAKSITPGMPQLGFWPPLLHAVLFPFVLAFPVPLAKDVGAYAMLLPMFLASVYFMFRILRNLNVAPRLCLMGAALIMLHPFVLYFTTSAMSEVPLIFTVLGATYFATRWRLSPTLTNLTVFGAFVSLCVTARYEGVLLAPVALCFVAAECFRRKTTFAQAKAEVVIFTFMASLGTLFIMAYSYAYSGSLFGFLSLGSDKVLDVSVISRQASTFSDIKRVFSIFYYASTYMHGRIVVLAWFVALPVVLLRRKSMELFTVLMLLSPALFVMFMMLTGKSGIQVPDVRPFKEQFANTRYALTWVGALYVVFLLALDSIPQRMFVTKAARYVGCALLLGASVVWSAYVIFVSDFSTIRKDETASRPLPQSFFAEYDSGRVLMTRDHNVREMYFSSIPTEQLVIETNYRYFDQALREPWLFARWVVVRPQAGGAISFKRLEAFQTIESNPVFRTYYELVTSVGPVRVYRLRTDVLRSASIELGYDPDLIPSLNPNAEWDPPTFYQTLGAGRR